MTDADRDTVTHQYEFDCEFCDVEMTGRYLVIGAFRAQWHYLREHGDKVQRREFPHMEGLEP